MEAPETPTEEVSIEEAQPVAETTEPDTVADGAPPEPTAEVADTAPPEPTAEVEETASTEEEADDDDDTIGAAEDDDDDEDMDDDDGDDSGEDQSNKTPSPFKRGDLIDATIISTSPTQVDIDLGDGHTGIVPGRELEKMGVKALEELSEGEQIRVYVVNPNDHRGRTLLSINRAIEETNWIEAEEYQKSQTVYEGHIAGYNKGGLIVRFGRLRGFVPQSQIGDDRRRKMSGDTPEELYSEMVNDEVSVKVIEVDRSRNRLILSERAASRELREKRKEAMIQELTVGEIREGDVVSLEDFGAFVDVGGAEGLVHLTEISWKHITHPREVLKVGQTVRVEVISIDRDRKRIGLSIKRQEADPWDEVATTYGDGQLVKGRVTKLTKFGAFAQLEDAPEIEGLIHISELSDQRVSHPREVVNEGDELTLRVVKIDVKNRRLGLSLKRVNSAEYLDMDMDQFFDDED